MSYKFWSDIKKSIKPLLEDLVLDEDKIFEIIQKHLLELNELEKLQVVVKDKTKKKHIADSKINLKKLLYSYYAQKNMPLDKWNKKLTNFKFVMKENNRQKIYREQQVTETYPINPFRASKEWSFEVSDNFYEAITPLARKPLEHFKSCIEANVYSEYPDKDINHLLEMQYNNMITLITNKVYKFNKTELFACLKTELILCAMETLDKEESIAVADNLLEELNYKSSIKYSNKLKIIEGYTMDLICFD